MYVGDDHGHCRLLHKVKRLSDISKHYLSWAQSKDLSWAQSKDLSWAQSKDLSWAQSKESPTAPSSERMKAVKGKKWLRIIQLGLPS